MPMLPPDAQVGITPPGALGVALFHHLTGGLERAGDGSVCFLERGVSNATRLFLDQGVLRIGLATEVRELRFQDHVAPGWKDPAPGPRIVLVCTNPDQLFGVVDDFVARLGLLHGQGRLVAGTDAIPAVVLCANGIYFQRVRQVLVEKLEEAVMLGRLPDLWPELMPQIVGSWMRGVTIQTGLRVGTGAEAVYRPGPRGLTSLAGGQTTLRAAVVSRLSGLGAWCEDAGARTPSAVEFQKAIVNLNGNLIGLLSCIAEDGTFTPLSVREVHSAERLPAMRELTRHILEVGRAVRALGSEDTLEAQIERITRVAADLDGHVPSSVQHVAQHLRAGTLRAEIPPTESWLIQPLLHYARSTGLSEQVAYFEAISARLIEALRRARLP